MRVRMQVRDSGPLRDALPLRAGLRRELPKVARELAADVRERTAAGEDVNGAPFERLRDGSWSTLQATGAMVAGFAPLKVTDRGFVLGLRDRKLRARARMHMDGRRVPLREWIGVDERQRSLFGERLVSAEIPPDGARRGRGN